MKQIVSQMAGNVFLVHVSVGDEVASGQEVITLESMKMEIPLTAEASGVVKEVKVNVGDFVNEGDVVVELE